MTRRFAVLLAAAALLPLPAAAGDAAKGENDFKKCASCHGITAPDGTVIRKGGGVGPNLYGIVGRRPASYPDYGYSESLQAVGATDIVWDEAMIAAYLPNPTAWLQEKTGDSGAKSKMAFKLASGAEDVAAYLASVGPAAE